MGTLGERLRAERERKGWLRPRLADESGVGISTIQTIEDKSQRKSQYAAELAGALGVTTEWLVSGKGPKHPESEKSPPPSQIAKLHPATVGWVLEAMPRELAAKGWKAGFEPSGDVSLFIEAYDFAAAPSVESRARFDEALTKWVRAQGGEDDKRGANPARGRTPRGRGAGAT